MTTSQTVGSALRTVNCMVTPSLRASFERTMTSTPPRYTPASSKVWALLSAGTRSLRSHGWRPMNWMIFVTASATEEGKNLKNFNRFNGFNPLILLKLQHSKEKSKRLENHIKRWDLITKLRLYYKILRQLLVNHPWLYVAKIHVYNGVQIETK